MEASSSRFIREWYLKQQAAYFEKVGFGLRFWQAKYHAFTIYERGKVEEKIAYMHLNPVKAGLVSKAVDWKWSSAVWYELGRSVGVPISWVE